MRIVKPPKSEDPRVIQQKQALRGMDTCPVCHSTHVRHDQIKEYTEHHFTWVKKWDASIYECWECKCLYESDPYNYRAEESESKLLATIMGILFFGGLFTIVAGIFLNGWITVAGIGSMVLALCMMYRCENDYKKHDNFYDNYEPVEVLPVETETSQPNSSIPPGAYSMIKINGTDYYVDIQGNILVNGNPAFHIKSPDLPIKKQY